MCSDAVIRVDNLNKSFAIYETPRDRLKQFFLPRLQRWIGMTPRQYYREFKALSDVSFSMRRGETIGIIGRNGAGKSTLLQIICGTLSPTSGEVAVGGRIAALLELGAGFNPEFTGRENVYLNGEVLGISREDMERKFPEVEDFAGIGEFIDQPIKTYSSGMYVRLAFAVQACVDPEILIVDEALSVGDIGFQYKCFKRMEELRRRGVTILMVTHSTGSILEYADRCIVMDGGRVQVDTTDVLAAVLTYEKGMLAARAAARPKTLVDTGVISHEYLLEAQRTEVNEQVAEKRFGTARAIIESMTIIRSDGTEFSDEPVIRSGEQLVFRFILAAATLLDDVVLGISISKTQGGDVWGDNNIRANCPLTLEPGRQQVSFSVALPISSGEYLVHCGLARISASGDREELDQRRPMQGLKFWSAREQVGVVFAPAVVMVGEQ